MRDKETQGGGVKGAQGGGGGKPPRDMGNTEQRDGSKSSDGKPEIRIKHASDKRET